MTTPDDLPPVDLSSLLTILGDAVSSRVVSALEGTGLRHGHGYVVQRLLVGPATATEMARELGVSQQAVSKVVAELRTLGHVQVTADPLDHRRRPVRLTPQGHRAVERARAARSEIDTQIRGAVGEETFERLVEDLVQVVATLGLADAVQRRAVPPPLPGL